MQLGELTSETNLVTPLAVDLEPRPPLGGGRLVGLEHGAALVKVGDDLLEFVDVLDEIVPVRLVHLVLGDVHHVPLDVEIHIARGGPFPSNKRP
jgi:hypothetical protein